MGIYKSKFSKNLYIIKQKENTEEYHIFTSYLTEKNECMTSNLSICKKMKNKESIQTNNKCMNEEKIRHEVAEIGRPVCGICVSSLYTTYDD